MEPHVTNSLRWWLCCLESGVGEPAWEGPERAGEVCDSTVDVRNIAMEVETGWKVHVRGTIPVVRIPRGGRHLATGKQAKPDHDVLPRLAGSPRNKCHLVDNEGMVVVFGATFDAPEENAEVRRFFCPSDFFEHVRVDQAEVIVMQWSPTYLP